MKSLPSKIFTYSTSARTRFVFETYDIEEILRIYNLNGNFLSLRNIGKGTSDEIVSIIRQLNPSSLISESLTKRLRRNRDILFIVHNIESFKRKYESIKIKLDKKVRNSFYELEVEYNCHLFSIGFVHLFQDILGRDEKCLFEFIADRYRNDVIDHLEMVAEGLLNLFEEIDEDCSIVSGIDDFSIERSWYWRVFGELKFLLSVRGQNVISDVVLKHSNGSDIFTDDVLNYFTDSRADFSKNRNCGKTLARELAVFRSVLQKVISQVDAFENLSLSPSISPTPDLDIFISRVHKDINKADLDLVLQDQGYKLRELSNYFFYNLDLKRLKLGVLRQYYFEESMKSIREIGSMFGCSHERVRQIIIELESVYSGIIENWRVELGSFSDISNSYNFAPVLFVNDMVASLALEPLNVYAGNLRLVKLFYKSNGFKNYEWLDVLIGMSAVDMKALRIKSSEILIHKELIEKVNLIEFLSYINREVSDYSLMFGNTNFEGLISEYFFYGDISLDSLVIADLNRVVVSIVKEKKSNSDVKRIENKRQSSRVVELCFNYLMNLEKPAVTNELLQMLEENEIFLTRQRLLDFLNNSQSIFLQFGLGTWTLVARHNGDVIGGSIRDITKRFLTGLEQPVHISQILEYILKFREISEHALLSNLRMCESAQFSFFNCGFIGLREKKYADYWEKLPRINGFHFTKSFLDPLIQKHIDLPVFFENSFGYPSIHTVHVLKSKKLV